MGKITVTPDQIAAMAPHLGEVGQAIGGYGAGLDQACTAAAAAAGHAGLAGSLHVLAWRWSAALNGVAGQAGETGSHIAAAAAVLARVERANGHRLTPGG
jgi:hypothetical protein